MQNKTTKILPLGYFITLRTYGSWLHGDDRGSVDPKHNVYGTSRRKENKKLHRMMQQNQLYESVLFDKNQRKIVMAGIKEACKQYQWRLYAIHVRSNHVHLTVKADINSDRIATQLKARATRALKKQKAFSKERVIWSRGCSKKPIWSPEALYFTSEYTIEEQGKKMAFHINQDEFYY